MKRDKALAVCEISKNEYYYKANGGKAGRKKSKTTLQLVEGQKEKEESQTDDAVLNARPAV